MGMHTEDVDTCGRWKSGSSGAGKAGSVVEKHYILPNQPFIDANMATQLCNGSPIGYEIHDDTMEFINDGWLLEKVVPRMHEFFGAEQSPALVLARPLLWAALDPHCVNRMDHQQREYIRSEFEKVRPATWPANLNPIVMVHLAVYRDNQNLRIVKAAVVHVDDTDTNVNRRPVPTSGPGSPNAVHVGFLDAGLLASDGDPTVDAPAQPTINQPAGFPVYRQVPVAQADFGMANMMNAGANTAMIGRVLSQYQHLSQQSTLDARTRERGMADLQAILGDRFNTMQTWCHTINQNLSR